MASVVITMSRNVRSGMSTTIAGICDYLCQSDAKTKILFDANDKASSSRKLRIACASFRTSQYINMTATLITGNSALSYKFSTCSSISRTDITSHAYRTREQRLWHDGRNYSVVLLFHDRRAFMNIEPGVK